MRLALSVLVLASASAAQVAPGEAIVSSFTNAAPLEGLAIVNRNGTVTPVVNVAAQSVQNLNSVGLDPITNAVWLGSITTAPTTHGLRRATLAGAVLGPVALVASLPTGPAGSFSAISFDQNCNPIVTSGTVPPGTGGVFRVNRQTGAVTNLLTPHPALPTGTANCVDVDQVTGDIYFGVTSAGGAIYRLPGPFPNTAPPVLVGTTVTNATIAGLAFWPAHGVNPARVYWNNFATTNNCVGYVPAAGGAAVTVAGAPTPWGSGTNAIVYDRRQDDLWTITAGIDPDRVFTLTDAGVNTVVGNLPPGGVNGTPSGLAVNGHPNGSLRVCPQYLPPAPTLVTVETSVSGTPGDIGVIGIDIGGGNIIIIGLGFFDGSGIVSASFNATIGAGAPNLYAYYAASFNPTFTAINFISGPKFWPSN